MRAFTISAFAAGAFIALTQAAATVSKARADFYWKEGECSDEDRGMITSLLGSGNVTVASDEPYYSIATTQFDPSCTFDFDLDYSRVKWNDRASSRMRTMATTAPLSADNVDPKDLHIVTWKKEEVGGPVHPLARRQGAVVTTVCQSVSWRGEGFLAINFVKVTGC
ncbi:hypothetical protein PG988_007983 [Apiospora saccharicola]